MRSRRITLSILMLSAVLLVITVSFTSSASGNPDSKTAVPPPDYKVAFIADTGYGSNFEAVLNLIKTEEAQLVLHQGDFDYSADPAGFFAKIDAVLGSDFPYLASVGNHDRYYWASDCGEPDGCYSDFLKTRMAANGMVPDDPDLDDEKYALSFQGLRMVFVGQNGNNEEFAQFINEQLLVDDQGWKICSWHRNQHEMQVGSKSSEMDWAVYENCLNLGAIVATGHEHSYSRTRTLISAEHQSVDPECPDADALCVEEGKSFVFVSGLGGKSIRNQDRCLPETFPYGCKQEWGSIYTSDQGAKYGALFITFNVDGDPSKARGYFKNIDGELIDEFEITTKANTPPVITEWLVHLPFVKSQN